MTHEKSRLASLRPRILLAVGTIALSLGSAACLLIPDETEKGERVANERPDVRITAGAATSDSAGIDYKVRFNWHGTDDDGVVAYYEFAIDDTVSEIAWRDTTSFSALLPMPATVVDAADSSRFTNWHAFYIRAVDNEFARSPIDTRYFNARTIAPSTEITFPDLSGVLFPELLRTVLFTWQGEDLDSSRPERKPIWYEYKLVQISQILDPERVIRDSLYNADNILLDTLTVGSRKDWVRVPESVKELTLRDLPPDASLAFAVRSVDEAGATEPVLVKGVNYVAFIVASEPGQPNLTVREPSLGAFTFDSNEDVWEVTAPTNKPLDFRWIGDASFYGSLPGNVNYALDIPDVENEDIRDPNGIGGWIGWGRWDRLSRPITFPAEDGPGQHVLWIKMRDITDAKESERLCRIEITVVVFTLHKLALVCDDARYSGPPSDGVHDAFLDRTLLRRIFDYGRVDRHDFWGAGSLEPNSRDALDLRLEDLAQYQNVIWSHQLRHGVSTTPVSALWETERVAGRLSAYVGAGGNFFMFGSTFAGSMMGAARTGNIAYPKVPPNDEEMRQPDEGFDEESFLWKFLHLKSHIVSVPTRGSSEQREASGMVGARSLHPSYPDIELDHAFHDPERVIDCPKSCGFLGGLNRWEGLLAESPLSVFPEEGLDSLYAIKTFDKIYDPESPEGAAITSNVSGAIIGHRYRSTSADTLQGLAQGRVVWWGFQPFTFHEQPLQDAGTASINFLVTGRDH